MTRLLGAVLAGGRSSRYGSDKAIALWQGKPLIEHVIAALRPMVDELVICGRDFGGRIGIPDRPAPGMGPLGGLNAALHHAAAHGFDVVISAGCDTPLLPGALLRQLRNSPDPAFVAALPVIGCWPARLAPALDAFMAEHRKHSIKAWADRVAAAAIDWPVLPNVNEPGDLSVLGQTGTDTQNMISVGPKTQA